MATTDAGTGLTDWHCHLLPGVDDGPATVAEAVEMATVLARIGFRLVHCTPHRIRGYYDTPNSQVKEEVALLQQELDRRGIPLRLAPGREYFLDEFLPEYLADPLPLGESNRVLVELGHLCREDFVKTTFLALRQKGFVPLVAHPERSPLLFLRPVKEERKGLSRLFFRQSSGSEAGITLMEYLMEIGCEFQGNAGSFAGMYGEPARRKARAFLDRGVYSRFGTDLHSVAQAASCRLASYVGLFQSGAEFPGNGNCA